MMATALPMAAAQPVTKLCTSTAVKAVGDRSFALTISTEAQDREGDSISGPRLAARQLSQELRSCSGATTTAAAGRQGAPDRDRGRRAARDRQLHAARHVRVQ